MKIEVMSFKKSGKWYTTETMELKNEHAYWVKNNQIYEIKDRMESNHPSVRDYSGLINGFDGQFHFVVHFLDDTYGFPFMIPIKEML